MKILILGATGPTGQHLVRKALEESHQVTAFVLNASKLNLQHENLTVIQGDVLDKTAIKNAVKGHDAVLSALGRGKKLSSDNLMANSVANLIPAMVAANVTRIVFLSAIGVGETYKQSSFIQKLIFKTFLRNLYKDKAKADTMLIQSQLEWTIVCPVLLTDGPATGMYQVGEIIQMKGQPKISREDVADFMIQQIKDTNYLRKLVVMRS